MTRMGSTSHVVVRTPAVAKGSFDRFCSGARTAVLTSDEQRCYPRLMHWAVELPSLPGAPVQVSAESWKTALSAARKGVALSKFRVDFEEDNAVRVHDLITNERFVLRPVAVETSAVAPGTAPRSPSTTSAASATVATPNASAVAQRGANPAVSAEGAVAPAVVSTPQSSQSGTSKVPTPSRASTSPSSPWPKPASPLASTQLTGTPQAALTPATGVSALASAQSVAQPPSTPLGPAQSERAETPALGVARSSQPAVDNLQLPPTAKVFHRRDRERSPGNDLTYRERLIVVSQGTAAHEAAMIARSVWSQLAAQLTAFAAGKFVSIAVFDHEFTSRPERPPIAVLQWKDWRSAEPEVSFPGSPASVPPGLAVSVPPTPSAAPQPAPITPTPAAPTTLPSGTPSAVATQTPQPPHNVNIMQPAPVGATAQSPAVPTSVATNAMQAGQMARAQEAAVQPAMVPPPPAAEATAAPSAATSPSHPGFGGSGPDISIPVPLVQVAPAIPLTPTTQLTQPREVLRSPVQDKPLPKPTARTTKRTDELLGDAFEALQDLAFLQDQTEACEFVARISSELLPHTEIALSLYDIDHDELVLELSRDSTRRGIRTKLTRADTRGDAALRSTTIGVPSWPADSYLATDARGPALFAGIGHDSRIFGVIESHRSVGQRAFDRAEEGALSYIAAQLGKFLAEHSRRVGFKDDHGGSSARRK